MIDITDPFQLAMLVMVALCGALPIVLSRDPIALVLFVWWLASMVTWYAFGGYPVAVSVGMDLAACTAALILARGATDAVVALLFAPAILAHLIATPYHDWFASYCLGMAQFAIVGGHAVHRSVPATRIRVRALRRRRAMRRGLRAQAC